MSSSQSTKAACLWSLSSLYMHLYCLLVAGTLKGCPHRKCGRRGGLVVSVLVSRLSGLASRVRVIALRS